MHSPSNVNINSARVHKNNIRASKPHMNNGGRSNVSSRRQPKYQTTQPMNQNTFSYDPKYVKPPLNNVNTRVMNTHNSSDSSQMVAMAVEGRKISKSNQNTLRLAKMRDNESVRNGGNGEKRVRYKYIDYTTSLPNRVI